MRAVAENPKFAKKVGVPQSVGKEFTMKKMAAGGRMASKGEHPVQKQSKRGAKMVKMAAGGMPMVMKDGKKVPAFAADGKGKMAKGGMTKMRYGGKC